MNKGKRLLIIITMFAVAVLVGGICLKHQADLRNEQAELVEQLKKDQGMYNPSKLIVQDLDKESAENLAEQLNADFRWLEHGELAVLNLAEDDDILQVVQKYETIQYAANIEPDYYVKLCDTDAGSNAVDAFSIMNVNSVQVWLSGRNLH